MLATAPRLPGIRFEHVAPPIGNDLPRMDIAVFVGFARSGPLHLPVAVEDIAEFENVFGGDLPIARDPVTGDTISAYLSAAVRSFFANGGRRCWVIRCADAAKAETRVIPIPGLSRVVSTDEVFAPAVAKARSPGSWADGLSSTMSLNAVSIGKVTVHRISSAIWIEPARSGAINRGDLVRVTFPPTDGNTSNDRFGFLMAVASPRERKAGQGEAFTGPIWWFRLGDESTSTEPVGKPRTPSELWEGAGATYIANLAQDRIDAIRASSGVGECLTFDLSVNEGDQQVALLRNLGFVPTSPRYWATLPGDDQLYRPEHDPAAAHDRPALKSGLWSEVVSPRFPLGCGDDAGDIYLPITSIDTSPEDRAKARAALDRDGLKEFSPALFIDRGLLDLGVDSLLSAGGYLRYQSPSPRRLTGMHAALLGLEEASLIAVPDAIHRPWTIRPLPLRQTVFAISPSPALDPPCAPALPEQGAPGLFAECGLLSGPVLAITDPHPDSEHIESIGYRLDWTASADPNATYELEESTRDDFIGAVSNDVAAERSRTFEKSQAGSFFYRIRAISGGAASAWSNVVGVAISARQGADLLPVSDYSTEELLQVHRALIELCAARSDLLGVLALPQHLRAESALDYARGLVQSLDARTASFAALYHPWLIESTKFRDAESRAIPPDGATVGVIAQRSNARGAWIAPANAPFSNLLAVTPEIEPDMLLDLQEHGINVIRSTPHGFLCMGANTLSLDEEVRPINVRRLLILLRRLALRRGSTYVFEPNDIAFRRMVQRGFEATLDDLFIRGAFAGATPDQSYRVNVGESLNGPVSVELGRLIVELRVAPSRPLTFLTVRLIQTGDRALAMLEG